jgi:hypothetical protein
MNRNILMAAMLLPATSLYAGKFQLNKDQSAGNFSIGTRNTISMFNDDNAIGKGIGGQSRFQFSDHLNSEWFADYISSQKGHYTHRDDYHVGWSLMYYFGKNVHFDHLLQPYLIAGHCFDYSVVMEQKNKKNSADRLSSATQAGLATHFNITKRFDCSLSGQYMLHFGKEIHTSVTDEVVTIKRDEHTNPDGHLLFTISFNYKFVNLWRGWAVM